MHRLVMIFVMSLIFCVFFPINTCKSAVAPLIEREAVIITTEQIEEPTIADKPPDEVTKPLQQYTTMYDIDIFKEKPIVYNIDVTDEDIDLIALVTMAEAEGECEEGKRLVIDTILNRVECEYFPNSVYKVVYQPKHFTSMWNGRAERCVVDDDIRQLVIEELISRTNYDVIFFTAGRYSKYGVPLFQVENHYFSKYE